MTTWSLDSGDSRLIDWCGDVMITDPPYREYVHAAATSHSHIRGARHRDLGFSHLDEGLRKWVCGVAARVERWSVIHTDTESVGAWVEGLSKAGAHYIRSIPWVRWSMPQLSGDRPPQGHEMIVVAYGKGAGKKHWNGPGNLTHLAHLCLRGEGKHKAEKPLDQILDLVGWFSDAGETVIDPFAGSGTSGLACLLLGRSWRGCEIDEEWRQKAAVRLRRGEKGALDERDTQRYDRWKAAHEIIQADKARMRTVSDKALAKAMARRAKEAT